MILDAAVGYVMEKIDMVLCGAEGVVESGGIINKVIEKKFFFFFLNGFHFSTGYVSSIGFLLQLTKNLINVNINK